MEVVVADRVAFLLTSHPHLTPVHLPATALSDSAQFLDVDVEEFARPLPLITHDGTGGTIDETKA